MTDGKPAVNLTFDADRLKQYQPRLRLSPEADTALEKAAEQADSDHPGPAYGYIAESEAEDTDVYCYLFRFVDEHTSGDGTLVSTYTRPVYVFVDSGTGDVETVVYDAYHSTAAELADTTANPVFDVDELYYHFTAADSDGRVGEATPLSNWLEVRDQWRSCDFYEYYAREAFENPWVMLERNDWHAADPEQGLTHRIVRRLPFVGGCS